MNLYVLALALTILQRPSGAATDACADLIPVGVRLAIMRQFRNYELPREADNHELDIQDNRAAGGNGCLGAAVGRFTGKRGNDYALLLTERGSGHVVFVLATSVSAEWRFEVLHDYGFGYRDRLFVSTAPAGHYRAVPGLRQSSELSEFTSNWPGVFTGKPGATADVYLFDGKAWISLPISN